MATVSATPTATTININGTSTKSGTISWECPAVPKGSKIISCVLTGKLSLSMYTGSATVTVNGTTVTTSTQFSINLGTSNTITSVPTTAAGGSRFSFGSATFVLLSYVVTYEEQATTKTENIVIGTSTVQTIYLGTTEIVRVYVGDVLVYGE